MRASVYQYFQSLSKSKKKKQRVFKECIVGNKKYIKQILQVYSDIWQELLLNTGVPDVFWYENTENLYCVDAFKSSKHIVESMTGLHVILFVVGWISTHSCFPVFPNSVRSRVIFLDVRMDTKFVSSFGQSGSSGTRKANVLECMNTSVFRYGMCIVSQSDNNLHYYVNDVLL